MSLLSTVIITQNELANIKPCLMSVKFAQEHIVVDSGSSDGTREAAIALGAKVLLNEQWPGFGPQKNVALAQASQDWILSIDADERVSDALALEIQAAIQNAESKKLNVAFALPRLTQFCGVWIRHCGWTPDYVVRVFKRSDAKFSDDLVHEKVIFTRSDVSVVKLKNTLLHYSYPTPSHYWRKLELYSRAWAKQKNQEGKRVTIAHAGASAAVAFLRSYVFQLGFLDGAMGFAVCVMQAQAAFGKYFELYCLNQENETNKP